MVFTSFAFLCWFLPGFLAVYFALPRTLRNLWLCASSIVFYGWERPVWVVLMVVSTLVDYTAALAMGDRREGRRWRRAWLLVSLVSNLGLLAWFKYANLFVHTAEHWAGADWNWVDVILPVGISFYTFQTLSYTIDVYRGEVPPTRSLVAFAAYVTMFPQLVAGPIVRYADVHAEVVHRTCGLRAFSTGTLFFMIGFVKKVLVADAVAPLADAGLAVAEPGLLAAWTTLFAYSIQIYFDFSGYSDMATGLGLMLGFHFPPNFDSPYKSQSITEAWRRWHISLSTWLRDYLYIPLGGNRRGALRTYANLMLTMLLGGLWHGANWPFVCWGAYQGLWLCVERRAGGPLHRSLPPAARVACTWLIFTFGWSMFIARDFGHLAAMWRGLFGGHGTGEALVPTDALRAYALLGLGTVIAMGSPNSWAIVRRFHPMVAVAFAVLFVLAMMHMLASDHLPFLYFQF